MSKITWDAIGERFYETGVQKGVLYPMADGAYTKGVAWNGLTAVTESPSGAEATPLYADDIKYLNLISAEEFGGTIEAYTYPDEFKACNGEAELVAGVSARQQKRAPFGFCYRTAIGNDTDGADHGYKLHLIYNATAAASESAYATVNDSPEAITFSWEFTTVPVAITKVDGLKPTACLVVDSTKVAVEKMALLEAKLYGSDSDNSEPTLPTPDEVFDLLGAAG